MYSLGDDRAADLRTVGTWAANRQAIDMRVADKIALNTWAVSMGGADRGSAGMESITGGVQSRVH